MEWVRLDVDFFRHPRTLGLSNAARLLYLEALCWCGEHENGWIVPTAWAKGRKASAELVTAGLWEPVEGGWHIHDAEEHQPGLDHLQHIRSVRSEAAKKRWSKSNGAANAYANASASAEQRLSTGTDTSTDTNSSKQASYSRGAVDNVSAAALVDQALEILYQRRPPAKSNPGGYRRAVIDGLRHDHLLTIRDLELERFHADWTPERLADHLEPSAPKPPAASVAAAGSAYTNGEGRTFLPGSGWV